MAVALVTGASSGIGQAYAEELSRRGWHVVLVARRKDRLDELARKLGNAESLPADLADPGGLAAVEDRCQKGDVELLVNNAGMGFYKPFVQLPAHEAAALITVQVDAVMRLTHAALQGMLAQKRGAVVTISSLLALSGTAPDGNFLPKRVAYGSAKAFQLAFTQLLASELAGTGVKAQVVLPGLVATEFHTVQGMDVSKMPPRMTPEELVLAALKSLEQGETVCIPGLDDPAQFDKLGEAQRALLPLAMKTARAARYR